MNALSFFRTTVRRLQSDWWPKRCVLCQQSGSQWVCHACAESQQPRYQCPECALPQTHDRLCSHCLQEPPPCTVVAPFAYDKTVVDAILALKQGQQLWHAKGLAQAMVNKGIAELDQPPVGLLPVPSHAKRWRDRGYNPAQELALACQARLRQHHDWHLPIWQHQVYRQHHATQQHHNRTQRYRQLHNAFQWHQPLPISAGTLILIDDVMTTGATLYHLADHIQQRYPKLTLTAWVAARTPNTRDTLAH